VVQLVLQNMASPTFAERWRGRTFSPKHAAGGYVDGLPKMKLRLEGAKIMTTNDENSAGKPIAFLEKQPPSAET